MVLTYVRTYDEGVVRCDILYYIILCHAMKVTKQYRTATNHSFSTPPHSKASRASGLPGKIFPTAP